MNYDTYKLGKKDGNRFGFALGLIAGIALALVIYSLTI